MSEAEQRKGTRVTFFDQTGSKSVEAVIADTVTVKRILPNVITKMSLPVMGPDGQPDANVNTHTDPDAGTLRRFYNYSDRRQHRSRDNRHWQPLR